jgi:hypothetical protein
MVGWIAPGYTRPKPLQTSKDQQHLQLTEKFTENHCKSVTNRRAGPGLAKVIPRSDIEHYKDPQVQRFRGR